MAKTTDQVVIEILAETKKLRAEMSKALEKECKPGAEPDEEGAWTRGADKRLTGKK